MVALILLVWWKVKRPKSIVNDVAKNGRKPNIITNQL